MSMILGKGVTEKDREWMARGLRFGTSVAPEQLPVSYLVDNVLPPLLPISGSGIPT